MNGVVYLIRRIKKWLRGIFTCRKCGKTYQLLTFGYGIVICPSCYKGENPFIYFEDPIMRRLYRR